MDLIQTILMGIAQGLSEFLPISSSAHLVFTSNFYKLIKHTPIIQDLNQEVFLDIMLHFGTLIAVLIFFRKEICEIVKAIYIGIKTKNYSEKNCKLGLYIVLGTILTVIIGYPLSYVAKWLVFHPNIVGIILIMTGIILLSSEFYSKNNPTKNEIGIKSTVLIGIAQGLAVIPGFSRSGLTIATGLFNKISREEAARFSFLLSIPIILGASIFYPLLTLDFKEVANYNMSAITIGTIVSAIVGYLCIKYFLKFVSKFSLRVFGYYCIIMGIFAAIFFY